MCSVNEIDYFHVLVQLLFFLLLLFFVQVFVGEIFHRISL